jgi:hypothetical protein
VARVDPGLDDEALTAAVRDPDEAIDVAWRANEAIDVAWRANEDVDIAGPKDDGTSR